MVVRTSSTGGALASERRAPSSDGRSVHIDAGFTIIEVLIVVLIIGILVAIATPVFFATKANAERKTCFANQRTLEGAVPTWQGADPDNNDLVDLVGVVGEDHPFVTGKLIVRAPRCSAAPSPADPDSPTAAEGGYEFNATGSLMPCTFGMLGPHGLYTSP
jgi:prepilin-type N-terminal cleavage/methylation domain-containing protein